jgi:trans-aconitate 2-methyltransferase
MAWDPLLYLRFESERARPFHDLVDRIAVRTAARIVDLGCGPGNVTSTLLDRWPDATVLGVDSSAEMVAKAAEFSGPQLRFTQKAIEDWRPEGPVDVIVSNAALQWVPTHPDLLADWIGALGDGGALAFQVPSNVDGDAPRIFRAVANRPRWSSQLAPIAASWGPSQSGGVILSGPEYVDHLARLGCTVDAWLTTYFHVLPGPDPVLEWYSGTGLRPFLDALDPADHTEFRADVAAGLREAFPTKDYGTVLPFQRLFVIAYPRAGVRS